MSEVEPISPKEVLKLKKISLPPEVILAFNETIIEHFDGRQSHFLQKYVVALIVKKMGMSSEKDKRMIFDKHWLDVENIFIQKGWDVEYEKPAWNETGEPTFTFSVRHS